MKRPARHLFFATAFAALLAVASNVGSRALAPPKRELASTHSARTTASTRGGPSVTEIGITVTDMERARRFFSQALGARTTKVQTLGGLSFEMLVDVRAARARATRMTVGREHIVLTQYERPTSPRMRSEVRGNDLGFQHIAFVVRDMDRAFARVRAAGASSISTEPQRIPDTNGEAGGIRAFYFRDIDGHPLELIWYPPSRGDPRWQSTGVPLVMGIDHTALTVRNSARSTAFYRDVLGLEVRGHSFNEGLEQAHLSGVEDAAVRITGLRGNEGPGVEFLEYVSPHTKQHRDGAVSPSDVSYYETAIEVDDVDATVTRLKRAGARILSRRITSCAVCEGRRASLVRDPDGHAIRIVGR